MQQEDQTDPGAQLVEQARALVLLRDMLGAEQFGVQKRALLGRVASADHLGALLALDGFMDADDLALLQRRLEAPPELDVRTALAFIVTDTRVCDLLNSVRSEFDKAFPRWMPHINFLFPFVPESHFARVRSRLESATQNFGPLLIEFDRDLHHFSQGKGRVTFNLRPTKACSEILVRLSDQIKNAIPEIVAQGKNKPFVPHLTLGQCDASELDRVKDTVCSKLGDLFNQRLEMHYLSLISRADKDSPFVEIERSFLTKQNRVIDNAQMQAAQQQRPSDNDNNHRAAGFGKRDDEEPTDSMQHLWSDNGMLQMLILPVSASPAPKMSPVFVFSQSEPTSETETRVPKSSRKVLILLDTSSSMNTDERGTYLPPGSPDHASSPIAGARRVCARLIARSFAIGVDSITLIPWYDRVGKPIRLQISSFLDKDDELPPDLLAKITSAISDSVFRAEGATNLEAVLNYVTDALLRAEHAAGQVDVWLLTDGEPTFCLDEDGQSVGIVSNPKDIKFSFYNARNEQGLSQYEDENVVNELRKRCNTLTKRGVEMDWRFVCFGEAQPSLMLALSQASGGQVHPIRSSAQLDVLLEEFQADSRSKMEQTIQLGTRTCIGLTNLEGDVLFGRGWLPRHEALALIADGVEIDGSCLGGRGKSDSIMLPISVCGAISTLLGLEGRLREILAKISDDELAQAAKSLNQLRGIRMETASKLARQLRFHLLQVALETYMDALTSGMDSTARLVAQYYFSTEAQMLSAVADRTMLSERDREALSAGAKSLNDRLAHGTAVQKRHERQIAKIIASKGSWAQCMLSRECILVRTDSSDDPDTTNGQTYISLRIVEADEFLQKKRPGAVNFSHTLDGQLVCDDAGAFDGIFKSVEAVDLVVRTVNVARFEKSLLDPLSFSSELELVSDQGSLVAVLYRVNPKQGSGILFDAKELLWIEADSGGEEVTAFSYFRMLHRLAGTGPLETIPVPGTLRDEMFNFAIPIAQSKIATSVLVSKLVGLLCEPITGTCMAPLSESGLFYAAFIFHHLRREKMSEMDCLRVLQYLASLINWIRHPRTRPSPDDVEAATGRMFDPAAVEISRQDAPGIVPIRAFAYGLADAKFTIHEKLARLQQEMARRALRKAFQDTTERTVFFKKLVSELSGQNLDEEESDEVPTRFFAACQELAKAVQGGRHTLTEFAILHEKHVICWLAEAFSKVDLFWQQDLSTLRNFAVIAKCASVAEIERVCTELEPLDKLSSLCASALSDDPSMDHATLFLLSDGFLAVRDGTLSEHLHNGHRLCGTGLKELTPAALDVFMSAFGILLSLHSFNGSPSNAYGLSALDFDVVRALKDPSLVAGLSATQLSVFNRAKARKENASQYARFVPAPVPVKYLEGEIVRLEAVRGKADSGKPRTVVAIVGDVDHGKSTLLGHLLDEVGEIPDALMRKIAKQAADIGKESSKFAWVMDRLREERERGVTISWKLWTISHQNHEIDIVDTPGHASFIKNMAVGASLADVVVCVISAAKGEFENGFLSQAKTTQRELMMCKSQGIKRFVFAINKMDLCDDPKARYQEIVDEVRRIAIKRFAISEDCMCFVPISAWLGTNLVEQDSTLCPWWDGTLVQRAIDGEKVFCKSLLELMDAVGCEPRDEAAQLLMPLTSVHKIKGVGTVICGRILAGNVSVGDEIMIVGIAGSVKVRSIEVFRSARARGMPGDIVGLACSFKQQNGIPTRGMVVASVKSDLKAVTCFVAHLKVLPGFTGTIRKGFRPFVFCCTASFAIVVDAIIARVDKDGAILQSLEHNPAVEAKKGESILVRIVTEQPVCVAQFPSPLGRFVIRDGGVSVAIGLVREIIAKQINAAAPMQQLKGRKKHFK